jgi:cell wall-associated NlpC family hydrolase
MAKGIVMVNEAIGELRRKPDHAAEQVSQVVLAAPLKVLSSRDSGRWYRIEAPDGYRGWIRSWSVHPVSARDVRAYRNGPVVEVEALVASVYERGTTRSPVIREAPFGAILRRVGRSGSWIRVELPDGQRGYLHSRKLLVDRKTFRSRQRARDIPSVLRTAHRFLGVPYQWGGVSAKGIDCSGLTQTVFRAHGVNLPRDSKDQFRWARRETYLDREPNDLQFGHLVFFGESDARITHVGISLGNGDFLHSRGRVRINSLHPGALAFDRELYRIFRGASPVLLQ